MVREGSSIRITASASSIRITASARKWQQYITELKALEDLAHSSTPALNVKGGAGMDRLVRCREEWW